MTQKPLPPDILSRLSLTALSVTRDPFHGLSSSLSAFLFFFEI